MRDKRKVKNTKSFVLNCGTVIVLKFKRKKRGEFGNRKNETR